MKLKSLLKETKVWERKFGESLPTLEDTTKAYKLKLEQEQFKAKSKETGRVVVYKSKDAMDKAIKGGKAEPLDKKTSGKPEKVKGSDLFTKDVQKKKTNTNITTKADGTKVFGDKVGWESDDMKNLIKNTKGRVDLDVKNFKSNKMPVGITKDKFEEPVYIENGKLYNGGKEINLEGGKERSGFSWLSSDELVSKLATMAGLSGGIPVKGGKQKVSKPVKVSKQTVKSVNDLANKIEKNIDDAYGDLDSKERDDFAITLQNVGTFLEDEINYDDLSQEDRKELDEILDDIEQQVSHLENDELGMGSIEGDPREVSKRAVKFIKKFSTKKDKPVDSKPKTPTFVNDDGDVVANDFDSALELAGNLGMSEEELEYIEKEKDSEALGDYLDGHGYSQKESEWSEEDEEGYITNLKTGEREYVRENKMKLKSLLKETKVWERKFGEPLPTFSSVMEKHSGKKIDEQGILSQRAGINVFGDRKLHLMSKGLRQSAFDLEKVAKKKDEQAFEDILQRITITIGVIRSYLNKPKRSM